MKPNATIVDTENARAARQDDLLSDSELPKRGDTTIFGMGTAIPKFRAGHAASALFAGKMSCNTPAQARKVAALYRRAGITHRGSVLLSENSDSDVVNDFYPPLSSPDDRGPTTQLRSDRYALEAPQLAVEASLRALEASGTSAREITHLVTVTCTGFSAQGSISN